MELQFRPARREDAAAVVPLLRASSRGLVDLVCGFGSERADEIAHAFLHHDFGRGGGIFGYRNQVVAVAPDGQIVACLTVYEGDRYHRLTRQTVLTAAAHFGPVRLAGVLRRMAAVRGLVTPPRLDGVVLANLCVAPPHRSRGYGSQLVEHVVATARECEAEVVELDVPSSNMRAQRLYERLGWVVTAERWDQSRYRLEGFRRMERGLRVHALI